MLQAAPSPTVGSVQTPDVSRAAVRAISDLFLSIVDVGAGLTDGDLTRAMVWVAVVERGAFKLRRSPKKWAAYVESGTVLPDEQRPPVSVYSVSRLLDMPYETTRRHVMRLISSGRLVRAKGGVIAPAAYMNSSEVRAANAELQSRLRRCLVGLDKLGLVRLGPTALGAAADAAKAGLDPYVDESRRRISRIALHYIIEGFRLLARSAGGNLLSGLLFMAIVQANVGQISANPALSRRFGAADTPPPDEMRRPVSVYALAQSLRIPYETARRHVLQFVEAGLVQRDGKGVMVPAAVLMGPQVISQAPAAFKLFQELVAALAEAGVDIAAAD